MDSSQDHSGILGREIFRRSLCNAFFCTEEKDRALFRRGKPAELFHEFHPGYPLLNGCPQHLKGLDESHPVRQDEVGFACYGTVGLVVTAPESS